MAEIALDADALRQDRERYADLLVQAEQEIAGWKERADHLQQVISALDQLLALTGDGPPGDSAPARDEALEAAPAAPEAGEGPAGAAPDPQPAVVAGQQPHAAVAEPPPEQPQPKVVAEAPPPTATPAAPEPVEPPAAPTGDVPKGTDAIRLVLATDPGRSWTLADLLAALGRRGWLPTSRRPEEGVRISLKRLAERGGAVRTADGRWRLPDGFQPSGADNGAPAEAFAAPADEPPPRPKPASPATRPTPPPPPRATSFGRPVGGTVTEL